MGAAVPAELCEIAVGRTVLGLPYALFVVGSEVMSASRGLTIHSAVKRARRKARAMATGDVRLAR